MKALRNVNKIKTIFFAVCSCFFAVFFADVHLVSAETIQQEVTIYGLQSQYADVISIPADVLQSYQMNAGEGQTVNYTILSGTSAKVSQDGCVTPRYTYWKKHNGYSSSVGEGEEYDYSTVKEGDTTVAAVAGGDTYIFTIHVVDYSALYCSQVMDAYIAANISDQMTDAELLDAVCRFPAMYDYSVYYSNARSMIIMGGGDCWASVDAILLMCEKLGINAWERYAHNDPGAGSGHRNVMVERNGKYYELDAGYYSSKDENGFRVYTVKERSTLFSYYQTTEGIIIYQYNGQNENGSLEIPEQIDGKTVVGIDGITVDSNDFTQITLPDTLISIGDNAFYACSSLTSIHIPASVESIGIAPFAYSPVIDITVENDNVQYKAENGAIYSKDGKTLITCPAMSEFEIPNTVTTIGDYAFYGNNNLFDITIPDTVTSIGNFAFDRAANLSVVRIPDSVTSLGAYAFSRTNLDCIYFMGNAPVFGGEINSTQYDNVFYNCTTTAYYSADDATWTEDVLSNHGGAVTWMTWTAAQPSSLENATITLEQTEYVYAMTSFTPAVTVVLEDKTLTENVDYVVSYADNREVGSAEVTVVGIGAYKGVLTTSFTIVKAERTARLSVNTYTIAENGMARVTSVSSSGGHTYSSSDESVATINSYGVICGKAAGEAVITVHIPEDDCYYASTASVKIKVTHDYKGALLVDGTVTNATVQVICPQCHAILTATVPTKIYVSWREETDNSYTSTVNTTRMTGTAVECYVMTYQDVDLDELEVVSDHPEVAVVEEGNIIRFLTAGTATISARPKYNPAIAKTFTFTVQGENTGTGESGGDNGGTGNTDTGNTNTETPNAGDDTTPEAGATDTESFPVEEKEYSDNKTGISYLLTTGNEATLTSVDEDLTKGKISIPDTITAGGKTYYVTAIAKNAFKGNTKITSLKIGSRIKSIGKSAFEGCKNLKTVVIGKNVEKIDARAFFGCKKLKMLTIKTSGLSLKRIGVKAFGKTPKNMTVKLPKKKFKAYKSILTKRGINKKARFKR